MRCSDHAEWHGAPGAAPRDGFPAADKTAQPDRTHPGTDRGGRGPGEPRPPGRIIAAVAEAVTFLDDIEATWTSRRAGPLPNRPARAAQPRLHE